MPSRQGGQILFGRATRWWKRRRVSGEGGLEGDGSSRGCSELARGRRGEAATPRRAEGVDGDAERGGAGEAETSRSILKRTRRESRSVVGSVASCRITLRMTGIRPDWRALWSWRRVDDGENVKVGIGGFRHALERAEGRALFRKYGGSMNLNLGTRARRAPRSWSRTSGTPPFSGNFSVACRASSALPPLASRLVFEHLRWNEHEFAEESTDGGVVSAKNQSAMAATRPSRTCLGTVETKPKPNTPNRRSSFRMSPCGSACMTPVIN